VAVHKMAVAHLGVIPRRQLVALVPLVLVSNVVVASFAWWLVGLVI
jgi:hypothetical protein